MSGSLSFELHPGDASHWNDLIVALPGAHILQTREWGQLKSHFGWQPLYRVWSDERGDVRAAALVLERTLPPRGLAARLRILYVPKGPLLDWEDVALRGRVLEDLARLARQRSAIFIKIDPDVSLGSGFPGQPGASDHAAGVTLADELAGLGWQFSSEQVQFRNTILVDLSSTPQEILAKMKQKTRYNIRLAERKGVSVRVGTLEDLPLLYRMFAETADRDGFVIREPGYYQQLWNDFIRAGLAEALIAEVNGESTAAVVIFRFARRAWYMNGMSRLAHREKMPNHLLQWEAIQRARDAGALMYDFWGAPDDFNEEDPLWGVYRFKEGFGGQVVRHIGAWDFPANTFLYPLYARMLPRILDWMRRRGKERTRRMIMG